MNVAALQEGIVGERVECFQLGGCRVNLVAAKVEEVATVSQAGEVYRSYKENMNLVFGRDGIITDPNTAGTDVKLIMS